VAQDLAKIHSHGLFHKDSHFGNILCQSECPIRIFWIDNDLKKINPKNNQYEKIALNRFQKVLGQNIISPKEWGLFLENYFSYLQ